MTKRTSLHAWAMRFGLCGLLLLGLPTPALDAVAQTAQATQTAPAPQPTPPLTYQQVLDLLKNEVPETEVKAQIVRFGVDFELTREQTITLSKAGASLELFDVIDNNRFQELIISTPQNGGDCKEQTRVLGRSIKISGSHLWIFARRQGLAGWWPQGGEVYIESDGTWKQNVWLGQPHDVGFNFEIKALWVNDTVHQDMLNYLTRGDRENHYPPISLPDGTLSAQVICNKIN